MTPACYLLLALCIIGEAAEPNPAFTVDVIRGQPGQSNSVVWYHLRIRGLEKRFLIQGNTDLPGLFDPPRIWVVGLDGAGRLVVVKNAGIVPDPKLQIQVFDAAPGPPKGPNASLELEGLWPADTNAQLIISDDGTRVILEDKRSRRAFRITGEPHDPRIEERVD